MYSCWSYQCLCKQNSQRDMKRVKDCYTGQQLLISNVWAMLLHHATYARVSLYVFNILYCIVLYYMCSHIEPRGALLCLQDNWDAAVDLFNQLKGNHLGVRANNVTYNILMSACLARDKPQTVSTYLMIVHITACVAVGSEH